MVKNPGPLRLLGLILLAAIALRVWGIQEKSLWLDELMSLERASGFSLSSEAIPPNRIVQPPIPTQLKPTAPWQNIWRSAGDAHPPLYYLILRGWRTAFGESGTAARLLSVFCSVLAVYFLFASAQTCFGTETALLASALMALSIPQIAYAQEVRSYAPLLACVLGCAYYFLKLDKEGFTPARFLSFTALALAAALIHYVAFTALFALLLYSLVSKPAQAKNGQLGGIFIAAAAFLALWGGFLNSQSSSFASNVWLKEFSGQHTINTVLRFFALPVRLLVEVPGFLKWPELSMPQAAAGFSAMLLMAFALVKHSTRFAWFWLLWALIPAGFFLTLDLTQSTVYLRLIRYVLIASPGVYVLAALPLKRLPKAYFLPVAVAGLAFLAIQAPSAWQEPTKPDWRLIAAHLDEHAQASDVVAYEGFAMQPGFSKYLQAGVAFYLKNTNRRTLLLEGELNAATLQELQRAREVWLVTAFKSRRALELLKGFTEINHYQFGPGSELVELARSQPTGVGVDSQQLRR